LFKPLECELELRIRHIGVQIRTEGRRCSDLAPRGGLLGRMVDGVEQLSFGRRQCFLIVVDSLFQREEFLQLRLYSWIPEETLSVGAFLGQQFLVRLREALFDRELR
jgi:hypothetical protein